MDMGDARNAAACIRGIIVRPDLLEQFGAAMNGRPILVYGPAGSGKTTISERLVGLLSGNVAIPRYRGR
jgi:ATP/maltotriose-dependent transcriptional regulator MalT